MWRALYFTLITLIDSRLTELETENPQLTGLSQQFHQSVLRYDVAYKQSTKSFLTETIGQKDTARDKLTKVIEWVARYWMELPDEDDAVRGRRVYQPFKDFDYRRNEALMAQNAKWKNIAQVFATAARQLDLQKMGLTDLVAKANTLTGEIEQLMQQRQTEQATYIVGEMKAARDENEALFLQTMQYVNALLVVSTEALLDFTKNTKAAKINTPYIIKTSKDITEFEVNAKVNPGSTTKPITIDDDDTGEEVEVASMTGTYQAGTIVPENSLFLSGNKFWYSAGLTKMKGFRAYFTLSDVLTEATQAGARVFISVGGETTAIHPMQTETDDDGWYTLNGMELDRKPTQADVYIHRGEKIVIKEGRRK